MRKPVIKVTIISHDVDSAIMEKNMLPSYHIETGCPLAQSLRREGYLIESVTSEGVKFRDGAVYDLSDSLKKLMNVPEKRWHRVVESVKGIISRNPNKERREQ